MTVLGREKLFPGLFPLAIGVPCSRYFPPFFFRDISIFLLLAFRWKVPNPAIRLLFFLSQMCEETQQVSFSRDRRIAWAPFSPHRRQLRYSQVPLAQPNTMFMVFSSACCRSAFFFFPLSRKDARGASLPFLRSKRRAICFSPSRLRQLNPSPSVPDFIV